MMQRDREIGGRGAVVDADDWLEARIESAIANGQTVRAMRALNKLLSVASDTDTKLYCYENLGVLAYRDGQVERARLAFKKAADLSTSDPGLSYALGHCAAAAGECWPALLYYLRAFHHAGDKVDQAEFLRAAAVTLQELGYVDVALSMFFGALDRAPDNPWILESISQLYVREERWFDALDVQEALIDVLADGLPTPGAADSLADKPEIHRLVGRFMELWTIERADIERRVAAITDKLRTEIGVAPRGASAEPADDMGLTPLNLPAGLHLLVEQLAVRERNFLLLETAQSLWAKARHDRFDVHLKPYKLAAAIQVIAERLHWRVPTPLDEVGALYEVEPDTIQAAARVLIGRYDELRFVPEQDHYRGLDLAESRELVQLQRAILYGVDVGHLESGVTMLGD
ncbi:MAG: hypothetical protein ACOCV2_13460 [Persicimonas sp.]